MSHEAFGWYTREWPPQTSLRKLTTCEGTPVGLAVVEEQREKERREAWEENKRLRQRARL